MTHSLSQKFMDRSDTATSVCVELADLVADTRKNTTREEAESRRWILRCLSGSFKGKSLHIDSSEKVCTHLCFHEYLQGEILGRSCQDLEVSLRVDSEEIDEVHFQISFDVDSKRYILVNLAKNNPTWLKLRSGRRIPARAAEPIDVDGTSIFLEATEDGGIRFDGMEDFDCIKLTKSEEEGEFLVSCEDSTRSAYIPISDRIALTVGDVIRLGSSTKFELRRFSYGTASVQGIRPTMEDEHLCMDDVAGGISMFNVYDGHGGFECSKFLRGCFHSDFADSIRKGSAIPKAFSDAFEQAEDKFLTHSRDRGLSNNSGSVVCSVAITDSEVFCANLGDSRAVMATENGTISLSRDLKPSLPEETARIHRCRGFVSSDRVMGRLAVSRAIGDFEFKVPNQDGETMVSAIPEVRSYPLASGRFIVIACDGLFDVMSSVEVVEFVNRRIAMYVARSEEPDPESICIDIITESVMKRGTSDNVTIVLIFLKKLT